jgi:hypothetical protein
MKDIAVYKSSFFDISTASIVADLLLYNTEIEVFYMMILVMKRLPTDINTFDIQLIGPVPRDSYGSSVSGILLPIFQIIIVVLVFILIAFELYEISSFYI